MRLVAVDCDLRTSYAVATDGSVNRAPQTIDAVRGVWQPGVQVLFEIASAKDYTSNQNPGIAYNKRRWTIHNIASAMGLAGWLHGKDPLLPLLVSPSSDWTRGFPLDVRHRMAGCVQKQKDLREAEAMLWFYQRHPDAWVPLTQFLAEL